MPDSTKRVVVTGIGVVSPNGVGVKAFTDALREGKSGIRAIQQMSTDGLRSSAAGQIPDLDFTGVMSAADLRRVPRMVPLALIASREALASAELSIDESDIERQRQIGVILGTGGGGLAMIEEQARHYLTKGSVSPFAITAGTHGNLSSELSIALNLRGPSHVISTGCTSSTDAIGYASMLIRHGTIPMMLVGGADAPISFGILRAFETMRVISTRRWEDPSTSCRPFSADRDGFILGEGAWMFVLEDADHAARRGVRPLAEIAGYGSTCDAYHRVQIAPDVAEPIRAMEMALADAGASKDQIGYVNLHGTGTELNDRMETLAMHRFLGARAPLVPMSATKSMIGHPQGASGAAGLAATILGMRENFIHPTINLDRPDPDCDLDYVPITARAAEVDLALCNCIAFGSKNSALIVRRTG
ncbi:MAG TPA: beta-ketoacyl-[acyl-carrier-protein] synthase family protein [Humisphaera sp.]|nr:beta-ketoacyl-[acyl-carrier-protein] synthase family protein [Humisphaera sp.]